MDKNELRKMIRKEEEEYDRRKFKRMILAILIYAAVHFGIIYLQGQLDVENVWHVIGEFISCIFLGGITFYFNLLLWSYLIKESESENARIKHLEQQLREKEKEDN